MDYDSYTKFRNEIASSYIKFRNDITFSILNMIPIFDESKNLLIEIKDWLANHGVQMLGPEWMWGWILEHPSQSPREHHESAWISVNLELMIIEFVERVGGKTTTAEYNLYDSECFDKLIKDIQSSELIKQLEGRTGRASGAVC